MKRYTPPKKEFLMPPNGRRIPADEYVTACRTVKYHTVCRNITIRTNKFPVPFGTGKNFSKRENYEHQKEKPIFGFHENLHVWVKSGSEAVLGAVLTQTGGVFIGSAQSIVR